MYNFVLECTFTLSWIGDQFGDIHIYLNNVIRINENKNSINPLVRVKMQFNLKMFYLVKQKLCFVSRFLYRIRKEKYNNGKAWFKNENNCLNTNINLT